MIKLLAAAKEAGPYWVGVSAIAAKRKPTKNRADYFPRILEAQGYIHHHMIDGTGGIIDMGIDYLIEHQHI
jgi:hypothetical protein